MNTQNLKYLSAAAALKGASLNEATRTAYRRMAKWRAKPKAIIHDRAKWILDHCPHQGRALEIGTGWISAYSLYPALLRPQLHIDCFDVADIRQPLAAFHRAVNQVFDQLRAEGMLVDRAVHDAAAEKLGAIMSARSLDEAYAAARLHYQSRSDGLPSYPSKTFDVVYSMDVLEHVGADNFQNCVNQWYALTKPGGRFIAQVGLDDHLGHYLGEFGKRYLRYSERAWRRLLGNEVQYINRITASSMLEMFERAGFSTIEQTRELVEGDRNQIHPDYRWQRDDDARAIRLTYVGQRQK